MPVLRVTAFAFCQENSLTQHDVHLAMIFIGIIAFSLVVQAIGVLIAGSFAAKLLHRVDGIANDVQQRTSPILDKASALLDDLSPKLTSITKNAEQISYTVREKVDELGVTASQINQTAHDLNGLTRIQVARVDAIVTDALLATEEISVTIQQGIRAPVRQIVGVIAGVKAAVETLVARSPFGRGR
jgi:methyl-accepting chemotaxis protein